MIGRLERDAAPPRGVRKKLSAIVKGTWMPPRMLRGMSWFGMAWVIAVLGLVLGVWGSLASDEINRSTLAFIHAVTTWPLRRLPFDVGVLAFWAVLLVWTLLVAFRLLAEALDREEQFFETYVAVTQTPNPKLLESYPRRFAELAQQFDEALADTTAQRGTKLETAIHSALVTIATMAHEFARPGVEASYGANIMLVANRPFDQTLIDQLLFFDKTKYESAKLAEVIDGSLRHILYMPPALLVSNLAEQTPRPVARIALPVPAVDGDAQIERYAIPGAPFALLSGRGSQYADTYDLASQHCAHFDEYVREKIDEYFKRGDGRNVRSFASWRIGSKRDPIGVLNIDSNKPYVLGRYTDFYNQFIALLAPMLRLLAKPVAEYADWLASHPAPVPPAPRP